MNQLLPIIRRLRRPFVEAKVEPAKVESKRVEKVEPKPIVREDVAKK